MHNASRTTVAMIAAAIALAGCAGSDDESGSNAASGGDSATARLVHVDGTITLEADTLTITPEGGDEPRSFSLGPEVNKQELLAMSAAGAPARVTYRDGEDVAAAVTPAPRLGEGVEAVEGDVVSVSADEIVIEGADGERSFDISGADPGAFDIEHLDDHRTASEPIRVYFDADAPKVGIAYEDA